jgi:hypothetical protein
MYHEISFKNIVLAWTPEDQYIANEWVVTPAGRLAQARTDHTSGTVYDAADWIEYAGAGLPGESAYQAWLDAGNAGTQADFLASLVGDPGPQGPPGAPGGQGPAGPAYVPQQGLIGNRPSPAAFGPGWYFATDDNGGTVYQSDGVSWTKITAGLNWASGTQLAYAYDDLTTFDAKATAGVMTDISAALHIAIPASNVPVKIVGRAYGSTRTGTSAVGANSVLQLQLADNAGNMLDVDNLTVVQVTAVTVTHSRMMTVMTSLPAPVPAGSYKLQGRVSVAAPANWGAVNFIGGGIFPKMFIEAVAE